MSIKDNVVEMVNIHQNIDDPRAVGLDTIGSYGSKWNVIIRVRMS